MPEPSFFFPVKLIRKPISSPQSHASLKDRTKPATHPSRQNPADMPISETHETLRITVNARNPLDTAGTLEMEFLDQVPGDRVESDCSERRPFTKDSVSRIDEDV